MVFTAGIRLFSQQIVGTETNPYRIAQKLFAAVDRVPWAGAREYSTISNISDYALHAGHADCGQQTLLLMTLLRLNGIPTRWQSGWIYSDGDYDNMHDWAQVYFAPYGWVPMDVTFGRLNSGDPQIDGSISADSTPIASRSMTTSASSSRRPSSTSAPTPWTHNAVRSNGAAEICTSINGTTHSRHPWFRGNNMNFRRLIGSSIPALRSLHRRSRWARVETVRSWDISTRPTRHCWLARR
jgi:transglutaminase-like putative cysteine protease